MTRPERNAPRMADVAARAGVSHQTVSRVLNGSATVREDTRQRVVAAIDELGYRRNSAARALVTRRSGVIGVVVAELSYFGPSSTVLGIETAARKAGYRTVLASLGDVSAEAFVEGFEHVASAGAEAVVLIAPRHTDLDLGSGGLSVPVVVLDGEEARTPLCVGVDQYAGAALATQHLVDLGHRHIAHLTGPTEWFQAQQRERGWRDTLVRAGLEVAAPLAGDWSAASGYRVGQDLAHDRVLTAVFAGNDQMAIGLMRALGEAGRRIPEDVSIVGFDDIPEAAFLHPPLTTVRQDFSALGHEALRMLVGALAGHDVESRLVPPKLMARASTARAPRG
jgi:DNA-binding LacI/PurR family transcriptional regulator